ILTHQNCLLNQPLTGPQTAAAGPKLLTKDGLIQGLTLDKSYVFYGIPFADPPVAASRWKPPRPVTPWRGVYDATYPRAACMQNRIRIESVSEDCLYLNVFVPLSVNLAAPLLKPLPVMLWIHGGDFIAGSASKQLYDGRYISNFTQTLVVSVAYRLGAFGFLVSGKDPRTSAAGNYGILDQQAALLWVQQNIAVFGGDPSRVRN
uniref:Si:ch73-89b15.3 n=1 Tax=Sinocyclocheilus anshuiensis TaxID=1608454 RepID=A0A671T8B6_9TELE